MKQTNQNSVSMSMGRYEPHTAKSTTLKINLEASFTPVVHNEGIIGIDHQNVYARKLASPVLHIARDYEGNNFSQIAMHTKKMKLKKKSKKKKLPNTKRNHYNKVVRSKSVNNNRRRLEKRINFYRVQNICNHFHRGSSAHRRESNNTPVHKKNNSICETVKFGTAAVPSTSIRPPDSLEATKRSKLNTTKACKIKTKKKNKLSMVVDQEGNKIDLGIEEYKNLMNSNRLIEPFSPTFEHPEDFLPSNQTSYRPGNLVVSKHVSKTDDLHSEDMPVNRIIQHAILKESNLISKRDIKMMKSNHNRTYSSHTETIDIDRPKGSNQSDIFKETGKFINPLNESADITLNHSAATRRLDMKNRTTRYKKRPKTGNGRHSRRSKPKNKSEDRKDKKRIFSKSVDQSYHDKPTINQHNVSKVTGFSPDPVQDFLHKVNDEDFLSGTEGKSLVSPSHKINKLIKESLKRNKEHETLKIIEQILKEEDNLLKKEKLEKLNNDVRKTNRMKEEMRKKKH